MEAAFSWVHAFLGKVYIGKGQYTEALAEFEKEMENQEGSNPQLEAWRGIAHARMGRTEDARGALRSLLERATRAYMPPVFPAGLHFALGEDDLGFQWLNRGYREHDSTLIEIAVDPSFDDVRGDARFAALLRKVGLGEVKGSVG
jgi:hypothetical protein